MPRAHSSPPASPAHSRAPRTARPASRVLSAARPGSGRGAGRRAGTAVGGALTVFLLSGRRARRRGDRTRAGSGARPRAGAGLRGGGLRAAARARRWSRAARRVRGLRGRARRCVLVGQFRAPRYVAARQPHRDGRPQPQSPRPHPPPVLRQWPWLTEAGSLWPRPRLLPLQRRHQQPESLPGRGHHRLVSAGRTRTPCPFQDCATTGAAASTGTSLGRGPRPPPSLSLSPRRSLRAVCLRDASMSPATVAPSQRRFLSPQARIRPGYLLPTEYPAASCGHPGVAGTSARPSPHTRGSTPFSVRWARRGPWGKGGRWRAANPRGG